jgi:hypothetical protein
MNTKMFFKHDKKAGTPEKVVHFYASKGYAGTSNCYCLYLEKIDGDLGNEDFQIETAVLKKAKGKWQGLERHAANIPYPNITSAVDQPRCSGFAFKVSKAEFIRLMRQADQVSSVNADWVKLDWANGKLTATVNTPRGFYEGTADIEGYWEDSFIGRIEFLEMVKGFRSDELEVSKLGKALMVRGAEEEIFYVSPVKVD